MILDGTFHVLRSSGQWHMLPREYGPSSTAYAYIRARRIVSGESGSRFIPSCVTVVPLYHQENAWHNGVPQGQIGAHQVTQLLAKCCQSIRISSFEGSICGGYGAISINHQPSTINHQPSTINHHAPWEVLEEAEVPR
jgi:hypothetical protein